MFGLLTAFINLIAAIIGGVLRLVGSILGGCLGTIALMAILTLIIAVLVLGHVF